MANNKGGELAIEAIPTVGINYPTVIRKDSSRNAVDLTGASIKIHLANDQSQIRNYDFYSQDVKSYDCPITDAANGTFSIQVPPSYFDGKWGTEMTYSVTVLDANESQPKGLLYGIVNVQEAY